MYRSIYDDFASDTSAASRANERAAFDHAVELLKIAREKGAASPESAEALHFVTRLWSVLLEDLGSQGNGLPDSLKASLISIGIWILRRAEDIRGGKTMDFTALIDVSQSIGRGLEGGRSVHTFETR